MKNYPTISIHSHIKTSQKVLYHDKLLFLTHLQRLMTIGEQFHIQPHWHVYHSEKSPQEQNFVCFLCELIFLSRLCFFSSQGVPDVHNQAEALLRRDAGRRPERDLRGGGLADAARHVAAGQAGGQHPPAGWQKHPDAQGHPPVCQLHLRRPQCTRIHRGALHD